MPHLYLSKQAVVWEEMLSNEYFLWKNKTSYFCNCSVFQFILTEIYQGFTKVKKIKHGNCSKTMIITK